MAVALEGDLFALLSRLIECLWFCLISKGLNGRLAFAIAAAALGSAFQHGYNIGVVNAPSGVIQPFLMINWLNSHFKYNITKKTGFEILQLIRTWIHTSVFNRTGQDLPSSDVTMIWSWVVSVFCIGGIIGGSITGLVSERMGRLVEKSKKAPKKKWEILIRKF